MKPLRLPLLTDAFLTSSSGQVRKPSPRAEWARQIGLTVPDMLVQASDLATIAGSLGLQIPRVRGLTGVLLALQLIPKTAIGHRYRQLDPGPRHELDPLLHEHTADRRGIGGRGV